MIMAIQVCHILHAKTTNSSPHSRSGTPHSLSPARCQGKMLSRLHPAHHLDPTSKRMHQQQHGRAWSAKPGGGCIAGIYSASKEGMAKITRKVPGFPECHDCYSITSRDRTWRNLNTSLYTGLRNLGTNSVVYISSFFEEGRR